MAKGERQSNIELLRIFAILGVIVLHYNNPAVGGGITYAGESSLNFYVLYFLESVFVCGVDLFMLISGYFMCESKSRSVWRPVELIAQVMIFGECRYLVRVLLRMTSFSMKTAAAVLIPANYFVVLYCAVYVLSPFLNRMIENISGNAFRSLMAVVILLFSALPTIVDVLGEVRGIAITGLSPVGAYGSQWGYTIVNFIMMYLVGAYLKKGRPEITSWKTKKLLAAEIICSLLILGWARINDKVGFGAERSAWEYCNPFVIFEAVLLFVLFSRIHLGVKKAVNKPAEGVFTVFLLHDGWIPCLRIEEFAAGNVFIMVLHIIVTSTFIYLICWMIHIIYHKMMDPVFKALSDRMKLQMIDAEG